MDTNFHEIVNENAPKLKNPHLNVDYEVKDIEKPFPRAWCCIIHGFLYKNQVREIIINYINTNK